MQNLTSQHLAELRNSCISDEIIDANFRSIEGEEFESLMLGAALESAADAAGSYLTSSAYRLRKRHKASYDKGGWYCAGEDIASLLPELEKLGLSPEFSLDSLTDAAWGKVIDEKTHLPINSWGCFKPDVARTIDVRRGKNGEWVKTSPKAIKYEHPAKTASSAFLLSKPGAPRIYLEVLANVETPVFITEGAKKAGCLLQMGHIAIGLPGVTMWNKPKTRELIDEIAMFAREGRQFYIVYDQDTKAKTKASVSREICKLASALKRTKSTVSIVQWNPILGKGVDDLVAAQGAAYFNNAIKLALQFEYWSLKYLSRMTYPVAYNVPEGQRYIDGEHGTGEPQIPFSATSKFYALIAPKGTGKTEAIRRLVGRALQNGQRVLFVTHRVQLTQALCDRTGIPSVYEILKGVADESQGQGICINSLHPLSQARFNADEWQDALIIIDECEQVLWELMHSSTMKGNRVSILRQLKDVVRSALSPETDGLLCVADADLSNISLDTLRGFVDGEAPQPWIVKSSYQGDQTNCDISVYESSEQLLDATEDRLDDGERLLVFTDSQKAKSRFSSVGLESRWTKKYPRKKILRVDSDTLNRQDSPAFGAIAVLNDLVANYDIVICSPSVETGVSLDLRGHFHRVVGFFAGVMAENSVRQSLARLRENVPRDIALPARGLSFIGGGELNAQALEDSQAKQVKASLHLIFDAARDDIGSNFLPSAVRSWSTFAARQNAGMACYRNIVVGGLKGEGHNLTFIEKPNPKEEEDLKLLGEQLTSDRHTLFKAEADAVSAADDLTDESLEKLERANSTTNKAESLALKKAVLKRTYPGYEITPDLHILNHYGYLKKTRLHYALTAGNAFVKPFDKAKVEKMLKDGQNEVWAPDVKRATLSLKVAALQQFKIQKLIDKTEISQEDKDVVALAKLAWANRHHLKSIFGFSITDSEMEKPVLIAKKFLDQIGYGTGKAKRTGTEKRIRVYPIESIDHKCFDGSVWNPKKKAWVFTKKAFKYECDREAIFAGWTERDTKTVEKMAEEASGIAAKDFQPMSSQEITSNHGNRSYITNPHWTRFDPSAATPLHRSSAASETPIVGNRAGAESEGLSVEAVSSEAISPAPRHTAQPPKRGATLKAIAGPYSRSYFEFVRDTGNGRKLVCQGSGSRWGAIYFEMPVDWLEEALGELADYPNYDAQQYRVAAPAELLAVV